MNNGTITGVIHHRLGVITLFVRFTLETERNNPVSISTVIHLEEPHGWPIVLPVPGNQASWDKQFVYWHPSVMVSFGAQRVHLADI